MRKLTLSPLFLVSDFLSDFPEVIGPYRHTFFKKLKVLSEKMGPVFEARFLSRKLLYWTPNSGFPMVEKPQLFRVRFKFKVRFRVKLRGRG